MKLPIKAVLLGGFLGLILLSIITVLASSYITSEKVLQDHARDIMENISMMTIQQSQNYLVPAHDAVKLTERLADSQVVSSEDRISLERYFTEQLALHSQIAGIYYGNPRGEFIYVMKSDAKVEGGFRTKFITVSNGTRTVELIWRDSLQKELYRDIDRDDPYDPRKRPWYIRANEERKLIWTDPYIFFTSQKPGITTASPVYLSTGDIKGIVGVDIEIDDISIFLSKLKVGKNGQAFIVNKNKDVIAFPDQTKIRYPLNEGSGEFRLTKISELDDALTRKAYDSTLGLVADFNFMDPVFSAFSHENKNYHVMFAPFTDKQWPWFIGIYLPEDDYLGPIKRNRLFNIFIGLGIALISSLIGLVIARSISKPMEALQSEAMAIKGYDLETTFDKKSPIKEVQKTLDAFAQMKAGLEKFKWTNEKIAEDLKKQAAELKLNEIQLQATFKSLINFADALIVLDIDKVIRFMNPAAEVLLHATASSLKGEKFPFPVLKGEKKEFEIPSRGEHKIIVEMLVVDTEWEGKGALLVSLRDISERKWAVESLNESNLQLKDMVTKLTRREEQLTAIGLMAEFFQVCQSESEVIRIVSENMVSLFPVDAGAVYIHGSDEVTLSRVYSWGAISSSHDLFTVNDCWALKKGQSHELRAGKSTLYCAHIKEDERPGRDFLCIPIATSQTQLGMLHLEVHSAYDQNRNQQMPNPLESLLELGRTVAEHIALALSNVRMQAKLHVMAIQDPLTGLYNRRYMQEYLEQEIHRARRDDRAIGLILLDIDHFKSINDQFGHHAGDHALNNVAALLKSHVRKGDICCRYGGEEFLFVLPDSSYKDTLSLAEKLRIQVKEMEISYDGRHIGSLTISLGVAAFPEQADTYDGLIKFADNSLYRAKDEGRDRVS